MYTQEELFRLNFIRILQRNKWSQKDLSQKTGIAESEISRVRNALIPLTFERLATICSSTGIEANEFYREDIVVTEDHRYTKVHLVCEFPQPKPKRKRNNKYEKQKYRFTESQMREFVSKIYAQGFDDGKRIGSSTYELPEEESYKVAEDIIRNIQ